MPRFHDINGICLTDLKIAERMEEIPGPHLHADLVLLRLGGIEHIALIRIAPARRNRLPEAEALRMRRIGSHGRGSSIADGDHRRDRARICAHPRCLYDMHVMPVKPQCYLRALIRGLDRIHHMPAAQTCLTLIRCLRFREGRRCPTVVAVDIARARPCKGAIRTAIAARPVLIRR